MVQMKTVVWFVLLSFYSQCVLSFGDASEQFPGNGTPKLILNWHGAKTVNCERLVEAFLTELRSIATDKIIELEAFVPQERKLALPSGNPPSRTLSLICAKSPDTLEIGDSEKMLSMRYLPKAAGFDASDWLPFQQRYLRPESEFPLNAAKSNESLDLEKRMQAAMTASAVEKKIPIYQRWWFWGALAATAGTGLYFLIGSSHKSSGMNVEIH